MEQLIELAVFAGKTAMIVAGIGIVIGLIASSAVKNKSQDDLDLHELNNDFKGYKNKIASLLLSKKELKQSLKAEKKELKKKNNEKKNTIYILNFDGDVKANAVDQLRQEITAVLTTASSDDEVVVRVESPGGVVHGYGLAASQLLRIRSANIPLTVCVDKVAASGGYMMACTANKIIAAPFAILGSIGVVAQVPNFHRWLKKNDVDYQEITAGEYKRTLSLFGEVTEKGKEKFTEQIQQTHDLFKNFVHEYRPQVDLKEVATGEYWFGQQALNLKLADELKTSDAYLFEQKDSARLIEVSLKPKKKITEKLSEALQLSVSKSFEKIWQNLLEGRRGL